MYTILVTDGNELIPTVRERIMQRSKLIDSFQILADPMYKGVDMSDFTVLLEYLTPVGHEYKTEILVKDDELYQDHLRYTVPFDTNLTREAGDVEIQLTFIKVTLDADGQPVQQVRKTSDASITIVPIKAWSDVIADSALTAIDQRLIQVDAMISAMNDMNQALYEAKADNIQYDPSTHCLQLTANGQPIGNKIQLDISSLDAKVVTYVSIGEDGKLSVAYSDGSVENVGTVSCKGGIYIPSVSQDGILTMTLSQDVGESSYSWDLNPDNDWSEIGGEEASTSYTWNEL